MKKVIVTGANGFIGKELCKELAMQGIKVIAVVKNEKANVSDIINLPGLKIVYCDFSEFKNLSSYISDKIDVIFHLAWMGVSGSLRGDSDVQIQNIKYTCDIVRACSEMKCKKLVFASSIMEYEITALMLTDETPGIDTLYCSAKIAADYMARAIAGSLGIEYIRAVLSNVYGPGELSSRLINTSLRKMLSGVHCSFTSGEQMYDFIYITDVAKAFIAVGEKGIPNKTYYIGSQNPKPLKEFLYLMRDQVNPLIEIGLGEVPFNGTSLKYNEFDIYSVKNDTGFVPDVDFEKGIRNTIKWIKGLG